MCPFSGAEVALRCAFFAGNRRFPLLFLGNGERFMTDCRQTLINIDQPRHADWSIRSRNR